MLSGADLVVEVVVVVVELVDGGGDVLVLHEVKVLVLREAEVLVTCATRR